MNELHSVVMTGMGAITARGDWTLHGARRDVAANEVNEKSGAISNFALGDYLDSQKTYLDRCSALALAGCALALRDAGVSARHMSTHVADESEEGEDFGIALGTHLGCIETMKGFWDKVASGGVRAASPLLFSHSYFNSPISLCAIEFGLKGFHGTFCNRAQSGWDAVRAAFDAIRLGHATTMLCGGVEALTPARALFEPASDDAALSEASVFFVLEEAQNAMRRNADSQTFDDAVLQSALNHQDVMRARFGDCGGASGALWIARQIKGEL